MSKIDKTNTVSLAIAASTARKEKLGRRNRGHSPLRLLFIEVGRNPLARVGAVLLIVLILVAILADFIAPIDPTMQRLDSVNSAPFWWSPDGIGLFGTDKLGRDLFSRSVHGLQVSLAFGAVTATGTAVLGVVMGLLAGYFDRTIGAVVMRWADIQFSVPFMAIGVALVAIIGPGIVNLSIVFILWIWPSFTRTIYASVKQVKSADYVIAARTSGASTGRILFGQILPNVIGPVIVLWSTMIGALILAESALSLLGIGIQPPEFSLGSLLSDGRSSLRSAPWVSIFPGLMIGLCVVSVELLGDSFRDAFSTRGRRGMFDPDLN